MKIVNDRTLLTWEFLSVLSNLSQKQPEPQKQSETKTQPGYKN